VLQAGAIAARRRRCSTACMPKRSSAPNDHRFPSPRLCGKHPQRPLVQGAELAPHVTGDEMVAAMDKVGVDGAIFVSPFSMYQYDGRYAVEVQRPIPAGSHSSSGQPRRSGGGRRHADWKKTPGTVGIRVI